MSRAGSCTHPPPPAIASTKPAKPEAIARKIQVVIGISLQLQRSEFLQLRYLELLRLSLNFDDFEARLFLQRVLCPQLR